MNNIKKHRPYASPKAELICLAPVAPIASWKWQGKDDSSRNWTQNGWGSFDPASLFEKASITGVAEWLDDSDENPDLK